MKLKACVLLLLLPVVVCRPQVGHDQEKIGLGRLGSKLAQRLVAGRRDSSIPDYQAKGFLNCCMNNLKTQGVSDKCINFLCTYNHGEYSDMAMDEFHVSV